MKLLSSKVLGCVTFAWLAIFWVGYLTGHRVPEVLGNRPLAAYPANAAPMSPPWLQQLTAWAIEHSPTRVAAISLRNRISYETARALHPLPICPGSGEVSIGRDGWLFFLEDVPENRTRRDIENVGEHAVALARAVTQSGRRFFLLPIPDKTSVYPEYLGTVQRWADRYSRRTELPASLHRAFSAATDVTPSYLPLWDVYQQNRAHSDELLYREHDTHWNPRGEHVAMQCLIDGIQPGLWEPKAIQDLGVTAQQGELMSGYLLLPDTVPMHDATIRREGAQPELISRQQVPGFAFQPIEHYRCAHPRVIKGRTVVISDSFVLGRPAEFAAWFEDVTFVHFSYTGSNELQQLIAECDTVVFTSIERLLRWRLKVWNTNRKDYIAEALSRPRKA